MTEFTVMFTVGSR